MFTYRNKDNFIIYIFVTVLSTGAFFFLSWLSFGSAVNYESRVVKAISKPPADLVRHYSAPLSAHLTLIVVDGMRATDFQSLQSFKKYAPISAHATVRLAEPTYAPAAWATLLTGASPAAHGRIEPAPGAFGHKPLIESVFDLARRSGLRTAVFGSGHAASMFRGLADHCTEHELYSNYSNVMEADAAIASGAISFLTAQKPNFAFVDLPGLDHTARMFGRKGREYPLHLEKIDALLMRTIESLCRNDNYILITSSHGHLDAGGRGGTEPEVAETPVMLIGPEVRNGGLANVALTARDIGPTICAILGLPAPRFNEGSFAESAFTAGDFLKSSKMEAVTRQKSYYYSSAARALSLPESRLFNAAAVIDEIDRQSGGAGGSRRTAAFEIHEKRLDMAFAETMSAAAYSARVYRAFFTVPIMLLLFGLAIARFRNPYKLFAATSQIVVFYCIFYWLYMTTGYGFSLSEFDLPYAGAAALSKIRIELAAAYALSTIPLLLNYFIYGRDLATWINHVFLPVFFKFNVYLTLIMTAQVLYYTTLHGIAPSYSLPPSAPAIKYFIDIQSLFVAQALSYAFILAAALLSAATAATAGENEAGAEESGVR